MFLSGISMDKNMFILLLSIAFVVVIIIIWIIVAKIVKSVKSDKYYKQLAKEELASLGFDEFKKEEEAKKEEENADTPKESEDNVDSEAPNNIDENESLVMCASEENLDDASTEEENNLEPEALEEGVDEPLEEVEASEELKDDDTSINEEVEEEAKEADQEDEEIAAEEMAIAQEPIEEKPVTQEPKRKKEEVEDTEDKPKKKGRTYNGKYEIYQTADGYAYNLKASNGEILVTSETYTTRDGVIKAINAVKRNLENGEVRIFADKRGQYKFKLVSRNYRILAISSNYSVEKSAIRASESFKKFALKADIVDVEVVDSDINTATLIELGTIDDKNDGKFVVEKFGGEYSWALKASNGQILCQAEGYTSKAGCLYSIETFKRNVAEGTFKSVKDKMGNFLFKLYNNSGRICAVGESYSTKQRAEDAARSVVSFYKNAQVIETKEIKEAKTKN